MPRCNRCGRVSASAEMRRSPKGGSLCKDKIACKRDRKEGRFPRVEWKKAHVFAEIAESLGIRSNQVMAATGVEGGVLVLYTVSDAPDADVHDALLARDDDSILRIVKHRTICPLSEFMARVEDTYNLLD